MKLEPALAARLQFLMRVVEKEVRYLQKTDVRLFSDLFVTQTIESIEGRAGHAFTPELVKTAKLFTQRANHRLQNAFA